MPRLILLALTVMIAASSFAESSSDVQKGRNGFLIYTGPGGTLEDYIHSNTLSEQQLSDLSRQLAAVDQGFRKRIVAHEGHRAEHAGRSADARKRRA